MAMTADDIEAAALKLAMGDRARIAARLLQSLDDLSEEEIAELWYDEAVRRSEELDSGAVEAIPADEVFADIRPRLEQQAPRPHQR